MESEETKLRKEIVRLEMKLNEIRLENALPVEALWLRKGTSTG